MELLNSGKKLNRAIHLLSKAAVDKKEEIENGFNRAKKITLSAGVKAKRTAVKINRDVHRKPWAVIGGTAAGALMTGFLMGFCSRKK